MDAADLQRFIETDPCQTKGDQVAQMADRQPRPLQRNIASVPIMLGVAEHPGDWVLRFHKILRFAQDDKGGDAQDDRREARPDQGESHERREQKKGESIMSDSPF